MKALSTPLQMTVCLDDGTEVQRPYTLRRVPREDALVGPAPEAIMVPTPYPGEEPVEEGGRWVMRRKSES